MTAVRKCFDELQSVGPKDLAELWGVSVRTIGRWVRSGKIIPPVRIGRLLMWPVRLISEWLDCNCPDRQAWQAMKDRAKSARH